MTRSPLLVLGLLFFTARLLAQPGQVASSRPGLENLTAAIQSELDSHGDHAVFGEVFRRSTRLNKIENCRAELAVQVNHNTKQASVRTETVDFSLGAINPSGIKLRTNWLDLPCAHEEKCVFSTSKCSAKTGDGIVIDCTPAGQSRVGTFALAFDGDPGAASRLEQAFRQAIDLCRAAQPVTF